MKSISSDEVNKIAEKIAKGTIQYSDLKNLPRRSAFVLWSVVAGCLYLGFVENKSVRLRIDYYESEKYKSGIFVYYDPRNKELFAVEDEAWC